MTDPISDDKLAEIRAGLEGLPEGPWSYRDQPYDDWGMVRGKRDADGLASFVMQAKSGFPSEEELAEHRRAGTDPWGTFAKHLSRLDPQTILSLLARLDKAEAEVARVRSDREYIIGWNDGFEHVHGPLRFPTMLRKMWSGGEVQKWLDEQRIEAARAVLLDEPEPLPPPPSSES